MKLDYSIFYATLPLVALFAAAECIWAMNDNIAGKVKKDMLASLGTGVVAFGITVFIKTFILLLFTWVYQFRLFTMPSYVWWVWLICFFADDFSYYCFHWCSHRVRFFWASHAVHHSAETFSLATALRLPWTSNLTGTFLFWAWMPLIGLSPAIVFTMKSLSAIYQFWLHTEKIDKMPRWIEAVFNTPSHHRVHHGSNLEYLDKNHGGTLMIWDYMFGTYFKETIKPVYGLTKNVESTNPAVIAFHEWRNMLNDVKKARKMRDRINFIFNKPGWGKEAVLKRHNVK